MTRCSPQRGARDHRLHLEAVPESVGVLHDLLGCEDL